MSRIFFCYIEKHFAGGITLHNTTVNIVCSPDVINHAEQRRVSVFLWFPAIFSNKPDKFAQRLISNLLSQIATR